MLSERCDGFARERRTGSPFDLNGMIRGQGCRFFVVRNQPDLIPHGSLEVRHFGDIGVTAGHVFQ